MKSASALVTVSVLATFVACVGADAEVPNPSGSTSSSGGSTTSSTSGGASGSTSSSSSSSSGDAGSGDAATTTLTVSESSLEFGEIVAGASAEPKDVALANVGTLALGDVKVVVSGAQSDLFPVTGDCATIAVGGKCPLKVGFAPTAVGEATANLTITSGAGTKTVILHGTGVAKPEIEVTPSPKEFPLTETGKQSPAQVFTIKNALAVTVGLVKSVTLSSPSFAIVPGSDKCTGSELGAGGTCTVSIVFSPSGTGSLAGKLDVKAENASGSASLSGTGAHAPELSASVAALAFGDIPNATNVDKSIVITNTGDLPTASVLAVGLTNTTHKVLSSDCNKVLESGKTCSITVRVNSFTTGVQNGELKLDGGGGVTLDVPVTANVRDKDNLSPGYSGPNAPGYVGLTKSRVWKANFRNEGAFQTGTITISVSGNGWKIVKDDCTGTKLPAKVGTTSPSCNVDIEFAPTSKGPSPATLTGVTDLGGSTSISISDGGGDLCATPNTSCGGTLWCSAANGCSPQIPTGQTCTNNVQCANGCSAAGFGSCK